MALLKSESTTIPGPKVAGPDVKTMIREPVFTKHPSKSPSAAKIAVPVDLKGRCPGMTCGEEWISSIAVVILNSHSDTGSKNPCFWITGIFPRYCCFVRARPRNFWV